MFDASVQEAECKMDAEDVLVIGLTRRVAHAFNNTTRSASIGAMRILVIGTVSVPTLASYRRTIPAIRSRWCGGLGDSVGKLFRGLASSLAPVLRVRGGGGGAWWLAMSMRIAR